MDAGGTYCLPRPEPLGFSADAGVSGSTFTSSYGFASSENAPETSTRLDPWHPAEKVWASGYSADGFRLLQPEVWVRPWVETSFANF